jgi:hypothetical protein
VKHFNLLSNNFLFLKKSAVKIIYPVKSRLVGINQLVAGSNPTGEALPDHGYNLPPFLKLLPHFFKI